MGRFKAVIKDREGKHEKTYIIEFSTEEEFSKEMKRIFGEWRKQTGVLNFWEISISSA